MVELHFEEEGLKTASDLNYKELKNIISNIKGNYFSLKEKNYNFENIITLLLKDNRKNVKALGDSLKKFIVKEEEEILRVKNMYKFDREFIKNGYLAGVDEVGRGPLAGPITAAAVILKETSLSDKDLILGLKDSKKLSHKQREELSSIIMERAVSYRIELLDNNIIDTSGISWCNNEVLKRAAVGLRIKPLIVISDGYPIKDIEITNEFVIKGDAKSAAIAAASIIAKVYRDNLMLEYSKEYSYYGFEKNAGYGTEKHISALKKYGPCKIHRMSFLKNIL